MVIRGILIVMGAYACIGCAKKPIQASQTQRQAPAGATFSPIASGSESRSAKTVQELIAEAFLPVYFPYDQSELSDEAKAILARAGNLMKQETDITVLIEGNTDERGTNAYNLALGQKRAAVVKEYLVNYGVQASRLKLLSFGEERPVHPGHHESDWALNRRDDFKVTQ